MIPLPKSSVAAGQESAQLQLRDTHSEPPRPSPRELSVAGSHPPPALVASSLSELRLPDGSPAAAANGRGSDANGSAEHTEASAANGGGPLSWAPDEITAADDPERTATAGWSSEDTATDSKRTAADGESWSAEIAASAASQDRPDEPRSAREEAASRSDPPRPSWGEPGRAYAGPSASDAAANRERESLRADWREPGRAREDAVAPVVDTEDDDPDMTIETRDATAEEVLGFDLGGTSLAPDPSTDSSLDAEPPTGKVEVPLEPASAQEAASESEPRAAEPGAAATEPLAQPLPLEDEPATNPQIREDELLQLRKPQHDADDADVDDADVDDAAETMRPAAAHTRPAQTQTANANGAAPPGDAAAPRRRPDSDAPTRPRIELSSEMALAAGRVTSLEMPPVDADEPRRGSKVPPPGHEGRIISSLTGRRSSLPSRFEDEEKRPAVIVTRSKIISDRPQRMERLSPEAEAQIAEQEKLLAAARPSRRPPAADGDEFETLDIEEGEVESHFTVPRAATADDDGSGITTSKAPPPPPQSKRVATQLQQPAPPKMAPPPPPRVASNAGTGAVAAAAAAAAPAAVAPPAVNPQTLAQGAPITAPMRKPGRGQPRRRQWYETLFSDEYLRTVVRPTAAQISRQVDFMQASLGVTKGTAVLDVGCGLGQQALEFARRGCLVVALDLALPMITRAAEDAQQEGLRINFLHKDIRDIGFEGTFDAVICVGTTFGFFDDEQNREVLGRLATALKPGGRLLLEVINRDHVLSEQPNLQWFEGEGCVVMEETDFNYYSSRLVVKRTMMREDGRQTESEYSIRLYALHELGQMMQQAGFRVKEVSGGHATRGVFFGAESTRIILLAERRQTNRSGRGNGHSDVPVADGSADA